MNESVRRIWTPLGTMRLSAVSAGINGLRLWRPEDEERDSEHLALLNEAECQLDAYMKGKLKAFDLPLVLRGTEFERSVWLALLKIPYGMTASYTEVAAEIGRNRACRAVGRACGQNPLLIMIPCHRVIAASGALAGYAGGNEMKQRLLELERSGFSCGRLRVDTEQIR